MSRVIGMTVWLREELSQRTHLIRIGDRMLPKPDVGQKVRVEGHEGDFFVKSVSEDGGMVDVVAEADPSVEITGVSCLSLMLPEVEFPD
jgi:hypothetical protein